MKIKLTHIQDALKDVEAAPPKLPAKPARQTRSKAKVTKLVVRFKDPEVEQVKEETAGAARVGSVASEAGQIPAVSETPITPTQQQPDVNEIFEDVETDPKILLARLTKTSMPVTSFEPKPQFPGEVKFDKEYCLYTPHSYALLKPLFTSHLMDAADLFSTLTGHRVPNESHPNYEGLMIALHRDKIAFMPYMRFMQDLATNDILATEIKGPNNAIFCRLEWGRDTTNRGMEYWKRNYVREDSAKARAILGRRGRKSSLVGDASGVETGEDTDYRPRPQKKRRRG